MLRSSLILALALAGCGGTDAVLLPDMGSADAGPPDAGLPDTGLPDTGLPDTGVPDTGIATLADLGAIPVDMGSDEPCMGARSRVSLLCDDRLNVLTETCEGEWFFGAARVATEAAALAIARGMGCDADCPYLAVASVELAARCESGTVRRSGIVHGSAEAACGDVYAEEGTGRVFRSLEDWAAAACE
ncbi:MAG: hypothetical protein AAGH15_07010 [Myxococcota bacterium]